MHQIILVWWRWTAWKLYFTFRPIRRLVLKPIRAPYFKFLHISIHFFEGRSVKPHSSLRTIRRLILEPMNAQYFCKGQSRSHCKALFQPASNQNTVFLIFAYFDLLFFSRSQCETLLYPPSNQTFDFRIDERTVFLQSFIKVTSWNFISACVQSEHRIFNFCTFRITFFFKVTEWNLTLPYVQSDVWF